MCTDIKKQWQKRILTKNKREPLDSFEILKVKMENPTLKHEEIANKLGYDLDRVYELSKRYFHASRLEAFSEYQMKDLAPKIISATHSNIERAMKHNTKHDELMTKHEQIAEALLDTMLEELKDGRNPSTEDVNAYKTHDDVINNDNKTLSETNLNYAKAVQIIQAKEGTAINESHGATDFIKAMHNNREEHKQ